jgi:hypothetical protein
MVTLPIFNTETHIFVSFEYTVLRGDFMKKSVGFWQLWGFAVASLLGTVLHFLFEWLDGALWVAPFSGVNESTWEHMKLLFWPMLIFGIVQSFFFRDKGDFWCIKMRSILLGLVLIPVIFYTYNGVVGKSPDWVNIAIFFISAAIAYIYEARLFKKENTDCKCARLCLFVFLALATLFVIFTFNPPTLSIFKDPISSTYGI